MTRMQAEASSFEQNRTAPKGVTFYAKPEGDKWSVAAHDGRRK